MQPRSASRVAGAWILVTAWLGGLASHGASADPWEPGDRTEGPGYAFQVFSRETDGGLVVYQARGHVQTSPDALIRAVWAVTSDPSSAPEGQTRRVVEQSEKGFVVHTHIDLPTFFSDRDIVTRAASVEGETPGSRRVDWEAIEHEAVPTLEGTLRIERSAGFWEFAPDGEGSRLVYESYVDLGGSLPTWLVQPLMGGTIGDAVEDVAKEALGR